MMNRDMEKILRAHGIDPKAFEGCREEAGKLICSNIRTFKESVKKWMGVHRTGMIKKGMIPKDEFRFVEIALKDYADQMDGQAVIVLK